MKQTWDMALPKFVGTPCGSIIQNSDEPQAQHPLEKLADSAGFMASCSTHHMGMGQYL
jgi:hypothetical protein